MNTKIAAEALILYARRFKRPDYKGIGEQIQSILAKENLTAEEVVERLAEQAKKDAA